MERQIKWDWYWQFERKVEVAFKISISSRAADFLSVCSHVIDFSLSSDLSECKALHLLFVERAEKKRPYPGSRTNGQTRACS